MKSIICFPAKLSILYNKIRMGTECRFCGNKVSANEIGLNKKFFGKKVTEYLCIGCMAKYFSVSEELLNEKIEQFKQAGCVLFV